jgi:hypothetical protein
METVTAPARTPLPPLPRAVPVQEVFPEPAPVRAVLPAPGPIAHPATALIPIGGTHAADRTVEYPADPAQQFVEVLRAAAPDFARAARAESAVVREAVPPARHRRARCRVVLRYADGREGDVTFVGSVARPAMPPFDLQISLWLRTGQRREPAWLVRDDEAADGVAIDVAAWASVS